MKKRGLKILSAVLVLVMILSISTAALAAGNKGRSTNGAQNKGRALEALYVKYAPDLLDDYLAVKQEHETFHEERREENNGLRVRLREQYSSVIDAFLSDEITAEQAKEQLLACRNNICAFNDEVTAILEEKKTQLEALKIQRESLRLQIQEALRAETPDEALIHSLLEQTLVIFKQHLALDYEYAAKIDVAASN